MRSAGRDRRVIRPATLPLEWNAHAVNPALVGRRVEPRYDPEDLIVIQVFLDGKPAGGDDLLRADRSRARVGDRRIPAPADRARIAQRNGHLPRAITTTSRNVELKIPRLRARSFFPSLLERRCRAGSVAVRGDHRGRLALHSIGKSMTWSMRWGADDGISKSEVSRIWIEELTELSSLRFIQ